MKNLNTTQVLVTAFFVILLFAIALFPATQPKEARRTLRDRGFEEIEITGYAYINRCGEDDFFRTKFEAVSPNTGKPVKGVVCSGLLKGSTIRTY